MNEKQLQDIETEYSAAIGHPANTINALVEEVRRLQQRLGECEANDQLLNHLEGENIRLRAALAVIAMRNIEGVYSADVTANIARIALKGGEQ